MNLLLRSRFETISGSALFFQILVAVSQRRNTVLRGEIHANAVLLDDYNARKLAKAEGLQVLGSVGLLETFYLRGHLPDLRATFRQLVTHGVYIDQRLLDRRLRSLGLPPL